MTKLAGEFRYELPLDQAVRACIEAMGRLGFEIQFIEPDRIIANPPKTSDQGSATVDVALRDAGDATVIRIVGGDSEADPIEDDALIAELDRVRDAIERAVGNALGASDADPEASDRAAQTTNQDASEQAAFPLLAAQRRRLRARVDEAGGQLSIPVSDLLAAFGLPNFSPSARDTIDALLRTVGLQAAPGLGEVSVGDSVTLTRAGDSHQGMGRNGRRTPGPGWYPDPADPTQLRWWNGVHWTRKGATRPTEERTAGREVPKAGRTAATGPADRTPAAEAQHPRSAVPEASRPRTNRLAIAAFVLSLTWLLGAGSLAAILLGGIAHRRIDRSNGRERGRDLAMAGIVIGAIGAAATIALIISVGSSSSG